MNTPFPSDAQMQAGSDAVVELALLAFEERWLRWTADVNCAAVQFAWNSTMPGERVLAQGFGPGADPALRRLIRLLESERRRRWPTLRCLVSDLAIRVVRGEIVFRFDLSYDDGDHVRPCEIVVDLPVEAASGP
jgi:hypothetical protein